MATKMKRLTTKTSPQKALQFFGNKKDLLGIKEKKSSRKRNSKSLPDEMLSKDPVKLFFEGTIDSTELAGLSDNDLIEIIHKQDRQAYREPFGRYQKKLFAYIYHLVGSREEAEDILQNVFSKTYKNIGHFDVTRKFSSWIYRIAHNEAVNFLKRKSKRYTVSWDDISTSKDKLDSASNEELPEDKIGHQEIVKEVDQAMKKISSKYQQVLHLRYFDEYSYEEIGKILGKPINTVGTLINRAKKKLLEVVKEEGGK